MEKLKPFKTLLFIYDLWGWKASTPHVCSSSHHVGGSWAVTQSWDLVAHPSTHCDLTGLKTRNAQKETRAAQGQLGSHEVLSKSTLTKEVDATRIQQFLLQRGLESQMKSALEREKILPRHAHEAGPTPRMHLGPG